MQTNEKVLKPGQVANILDYCAKCPLVLLPSKPNIHKKKLYEKISKNGVKGSISYLESVKCSIPLSMFVGLIEIGLSVIHWKLIFISIFAFNRIWWKCFLTWGLSKQN